MQNVARQASGSENIVSSLMELSGLVDAILRRSLDLAARLQGFFFLLVWLLAGIGASTPSHAAEKPLELISPAAGIHVHLGRHEDISTRNAGDIANTGFIVGEKSVMVIDPGGSPSMGRRLLQAVRSITSLPVSHVVLSHVHPDHIFGSAVFAGDSELIAHERYPAALAQRAQFYLDRFADLFTSDDKSLATPTVLVRKTLEIDLGNRRVIVQAYPTAHTDHDLTVLDTTTATLWASDLVFAQRIPALDGSLPGWLEVTRQLAAENIELIIPGHGRPGAPADLLQPQIRYLEVLLTETREQVAVNARLAEAVERVGQEEKQHWLLHELHHAGNITKAFTELEWE